MATPRTATTEWKHIRKPVLRRGQLAGITNCPTCGITLDYAQGNQPNSAEPDHIVPHKLGGTDDLWNLQTLCRRCNQSKGHRPAPRQATINAVRTPRSSRRW